MKKALAIIICLIMCLSHIAAFAHIEYADLTGLWYAYLAEGECLLYLRSDGTGIMQLADASYSIVWSHDGGVITLNQGGALVDGMYDENVISLSTGGGNLLFLREKPVPAPLDSDITGTWRAPMLGGDSILTLNADGSAVLQPGSDAIPLTWSREGAAVTLYQDGFPVDCAYNGVFISIFLGEGSICFMREAISAETAQ